MPEGRPEVQPSDGLTTRQRRNRPLVIVHTGDGKGKSSAAKKPASAKGRR